MLPGINLPSLGFAGGSATAGGNGNGSAWSLGTGAWNVNLGGSGGPATQLPALGGLPMMLLIGLAAWYLWKR